MKTQFTICLECLRIKKFGEFVQASPYFLEILNDDIMRPADQKQLESIPVICPDCTKQKPDKDNVFRQDPPKK
jgi:hypothetical protein